MLYLKVNLVVVYLVRHREMLLQAEGSPGRASYLGNVQRRRYSARRSSREVVSADVEQQSSGIMAPYEHKDEATTKLSNNIHSSHWSENVTVGEGGGGALARAREMGLLSD
jgi:hypothetical protein